MTRRQFTTTAAAAAAAAAASATTAGAADRDGGHTAGITHAPFGRLADGTAVTAWTVDTGTGLRATVLDYGGIVQSLETPDRRGHAANIALGYGTLDAYVAGTTYFGALIGRYGNRIAGGRFTLDGHTYQLPQNDGTNSLHGGTTGFDRHMWAVAPFTAGADRGLVLTRTSPDGEMGYPGTLQVRVTYTFTADRRMRFEYHATTDRPTVVNLTQHTYFNLGGETSGDVYGHRLHLDAARYTPIDKNLIPTGELAPVAGTPFDFRHGRAVGADIRDGRSAQLLFAQGIDHNFVLDKGLTDRPQPFARFSHEGTGRVMTVATTEPGVQFYTGNFLTGTLVGTGGSIYRQGDGFAFETQHFPDSPNHPSFPTTVLRPGETYRSATEYAFSH